jgi:hypothetical protein
VPPIVNELQIYFILLLFKVTRLMTRRFQETVGKLKKGETKHPIIMEKNYDEAEGKRAES